MKKYTIEDLTADIAGLITFEDNPSVVFSSKEIEYKHCTAIITGTIYSLDNMQNGLTFDEIYLESVVLVFEDGPDTIFDGDEIKRLEERIKLYI
jgi:hypothetical protein